MDLNVIRAGMAETPEESEFTSAFDRIRARWHQTQQEMGKSVSLPSEEEADAWLAPIFLDERAEAYCAASSAAPGDPGPSSSPLCNRPGASRISNKGFLPLTLDEYLTLLDTLGRIVREGKRGVIPSDLAPIFERLRVDPRQWFDNLWATFQSAPCLRPEMPVTGFG